MLSASTLVDYWYLTYPVPPGARRERGFKLRPHHLTKREAQYNFVGNSMRAINDHNIEMASGWSTMNRCELPKDVLSFAEWAFSHDNVYGATMHGMILGKDERNIIMMKSVFSSLEYIRGYLEAFLREGRDVYLSYTFEFEGVYNDHPSGIYLSWAAVKP